MPVKSDPSTWTDPRQRRGLAGERYARRYLEANGWRVLHHRFRMGRLEIDLVARRGSVVAFVEVKTRRSAAFGTPLHAVGWKKQLELVRVAQAWMNRHGSPGEQYRFDVLGVEIVRGKRPVVTHVEDAFRPGWR
jgi:putative endonuclease